MSRTSIVTAIFYVGERGGGSASAWDQKWAENYGGFDNPDPAQRRSVSPAVRDYLGLGSTDVTDWKFVEVRDVPNGPWARIGANNTVAQLRDRSESPPVKATPAQQSSESPTIISR